MISVDLSNMEFELTPAASPPLAEIKDVLLLRLEQIRDELLKQKLYQIMPGLTEKLLRVATGEETSAPESTVETGKKEAKGRQGLALAGALEILVVQSQSASQPVELKVLLQQASEAYNYKRKTKQPSPSTSDETAAEETAAADAEAPPAQPTSDKFYVKSFHAVSRHLEALTGTDLLDYPEQLKQTRIAVGYLGGEVIKWLRTFEPAFDRATWERRFVLDLAAELARQSRQLILEAQRS